MGEMGRGAVFAGHRIEAVAGRGGMGIVYRARQLSLDRVVALKVIAPALLQDPAMRRRFVRESRLAASIDHPNVIPIYYAGEEDGVAFLAMRYVPGDDLRTLVRREGRLEPRRAAQIVAQVAAALDAAHAAGLVHRDVKPANVLLGQGDHAYLTDFGLTKHAISEAGATRPGQWVGTLDFVSPEQIRGERVDARADVYALGCLLHYALTGRPPFTHEGDEAKLWAHLSEAPPRVSAAAPRVPEAFDAVVARALAKAPDARQPSAGALGRAAHAAAAGEPMTEGDHMVAIGAAAPVEAETRTAATRMAATTRARTHDARAGAAASGGRLHDDPTSALPLPPDGVRRSHLRPWAALLAALVLAGAAGVAGAAFLIGDDDPGSGPPPSATEPTPAARPTVTSVPLGGRMNAVAVAGGRVWVGRFGAARLTAVDPSSARSVPRLRPEVGVGTVALAGSGRSLWVVVSRQRRVVHLDARTGRRLGPSLPLPSAANAVAASDRFVWVAVSAPEIPHHDQILRFDARTGRQAAPLLVRNGIQRMLLADGVLWWIAGTPATLVRWEPGASAPRRFRLDDGRVGDLAAGGGHLWITLPDSDQVVRFHPRTGNRAMLAVGRDPQGVEVHGEDVWVANGSDSTLTRIDAATGRVRGKPLEVALNPYEMDSGEGALWVTSLAEGKLTRVSVPR